MVHMHVLKANYKKRKKGLMRKMSELSTLCGIGACAIMYSPYESQPEVWPSRIGFQQVLSKFKMIPEMEERKNLVNQESFLSQRIVKVVEQLRKDYKDKQEKEMTEVMFNNIYGKWVVHGLNFGDINDLNLLLVEKIRESSSSSSMVALPSMMMVMPKVILRTGTEDIMQLDVKKMDPMKRHQWIMELMNNNNNPQTHVGGDEMMFQFDDNINPNNGH
ncbi:hypothetical protein ES332_D03G126800v1 [Gossypium tomentosum]|uniref:MADS-box domain-containing protein n=1 Tax=Gossypium tomentosum TaxID=34277 RepID=A0A5D2LLM4_GOSTO|nr:hypothetical protein ES332_D03G126800v1 [Gossypium tomentosum]